MNLHRRLWGIVGLLAAVVAFGTVGYVVVERWSVGDALYMTVITVASVGFGEVHPLSAGGRVFTMVLIVLGLGAVAYGLSTITAFWVEGDLSHLWERRKMQGQIARLTDHVVVCGGGDTGRHILHELSKTRTPHVCIEINTEHEEGLKRVPGLLYIIGDATDTEVLQSARVEHARGLIACMPSDKDNLFTLLTARELNPRMRIVSRLVSDSSRPKLLRAGADAVVSNKAIGALRLASEMLRPHVVSFLDSMLREPGSMRVQEIAVGDGGGGRPLGSFQFHERAGVTVFAVRDAETHRYRFNPGPGVPLNQGDVLIACADAEQVARMRAVLEEA